MFLFRNLSLKWKLLLMGTAGVFLTSLVCIGNIFFLADGTESVVGGNLRNMAEEQGSRIVEGVYNMVKTQDQLLRIKLQADLKMAEHILESAGGISFSEDLLSWQAQNQFSGVVHHVSLPSMMIGDKVLGQNRSSVIPSPLVDKVKELSGVTCTIFQRMNEQGDMLRIATNVINEAGERAVGTYIPVTNPDGQPNPVIADILGGKTFIGRAFVVNAWYITAYKPLYQNGRIVGVIYVGIPLEMVADLRNSIMETPVGETGYVFVIGGSGGHKGHYVISQKGLRDGENIWEARDSNGVFFIQEMVNKAVASPEGSTFIIDYPWLNKGDKEARMKFSAIMYYEPWDWVIGAGTYLSEFEKTLLEIRNALRKIVNNTVYISLFLVLFLGVLAWYFARELAVNILTVSEGAYRFSIGDFVLEGMDKNVIRRINNRTDELGDIGRAFNGLIVYLNEKTRVARAIADGDITANIEVASDYDQLGRAFVEMSSNLNNLLSLVSNTATQVHSGSEQLADSSQSLSQGATEQAASLEQITSSMVEIASQSRANAENAEQASRLANDGKKSGELSREKMQEMMRSVSEINDSSREIAKIIKVIDDIAFQTNLLALNAAVEAARAGKHGKGFAVVAEEVRNLAARSAKAAKETAELIENSVKKVEEGTKIADQTSESLVHIIAGSAKVADYLAEIAAASNEQALGVEQINTGLSQVDKVTQSISANAEESAAASQELSAQALKLTEVLANFQLYEEEKLQNSPTKEQRKPSATPAIKTVDNNSGRLASVKPRAQISLDDSDFGKY